LPDVPSLTAVDGTEVKVGGAVTVKVDNTTALARVMRIYLEFDNRTIVFDYEAME
jgi:hypothetical protein